MQSRRTLVGSVVGAVTVALSAGKVSGQWATPEVVRRYDDTPPQLREWMEKIAVVRIVSYGTYDGTLPGGLEWMTAYGTVVADDAAQSIAAQMPIAIHGLVSDKAEVGTFVTNLQDLDSPQLAGADSVQVFGFEADDRIFVGTAISAGRWIQVLYGPTTIDPHEAGDALIRFAGKTMKHWA